MIKKWCYSYIRLVKALAKIAGAFCIFLKPFFDFNYLIDVKYKLHVILSMGS